MNDENSTNKKILGEIGLRCYELRKNCNKDRLISQREFAKILEIPHSAVSMIENGQKEMTMTELRAYQKYSKKSFDYLLGVTECEESNNQNINNRLGLLDNTIQTLENLKYKYGIDSDFKISRNDDERKNIYNLLNFFINSFLSDNIFWDYFDDKLSKLIKLRNDEISNGKSKIIYSELNEIEYVKYLLIEKFKKLIDDCLKNLYPPQIKKPLFDQRRKTK